VDGEVWRADLGEGDPILPLSVKTDAAQNVVVTRASGALLKLNASGATVWQRPFGSAVDVDPSGAIFVAGTFQGQLQLGSSRSLAAAGGTDAFVAKLDGDGRVLFAVALGGTGDEAATSIAAGANGVVVSGTGLGTVQLDTSDGSTRWQRAVEGAVAIDGKGNAIVAGALQGTASFERTLTSAGGKDVLVVKLSPDGEYLWSKSFGDTAPAQEAQTVSVGAGDAVLVGGVVDGSVDFGGGPIGLPAGACPKEAHCGDQAGFLLTLDASGSFVADRNLGPALAVSGLARDAAGDLYAAGSYPGDVAPYRTPLLVGFDSAGSTRKLPTYDDRPGAGHAVAIDGCGAVLFGFAAADAGHSYLSKIVVH
jgi:outer membrane protein assembly factor BamB